MTRLTAFVLRNRFLVVVFWLVVAAAGAVTIGTTTGRLTQTFAAPDSPAQDAADKILAAYHLDPGTAPDLLVVRVPAGETVFSPSAQANLSRVFGAIRPLGLHSVDLVSTADYRLATADRRTAYGLAYLPPGGAYDAGLNDRVAAAVKGAAPPGYTVGVTGLGPLQSGSGQPQGNGVLAETLIGAVGALVILAFVFASLVAVLPILLAAISILTTFLLVLGLTTVTNVNFIAQFIIGLIGLG